MMRSNEPSLIFWLDASRQIPVPDRCVYWILYGVGYHMSRRAIPLVLARTPLRNQRLHVPDPSSDRASSRTWRAAIVTAAFHRD